MNTKKILGTSIGLNILQIIFVIITIALVQENDKRYVASIVGGAVGISIINVTITVLSYIYFQRKQYQSLLTSMKDLEALNLTLREQRHDYLNQIQVVYGLLEMDEYADAKSYMNSVFKEITKVSKALKTAQPAINALLQAKLQMAEKQNVDMYLDIRTDLKELMIEPWELCKVLANIIDNGITALQQKEGEKEIHITMTQDEQTYCFDIENNGPEITEEKRKLIFKAGYTTKKENGHGMGLYIVGEIMKNAKGTLNVTSQEGRTIFSIKLPRDKVQKS